MTVEFLLTSLVIVATPGSGHHVPQFVSDTDPNALARMLALSGVFMVLTFVVFVGYGMFAAGIRTHVLARPRVLTWMRRVFGGAFAALGARLAFTER